MGKIFVVIGPSCSGKDTILKMLNEYYGGLLKPIVLYTTRPIRINEEDGVTYNFVDNTILEKMEKENKIIERRDYNTINGIWTYFTASENIDLENNSYLTLNTLEGYKSLKKYYGDDLVIPIYIYVKDEVRLERAINREKKQDNPNYKELARRFLADCEDFSLKKVQEAGITHFYDNNNYSADPSTWNKTQSLEIVRDEIINTIETELYVKEKRKAV